MRGRMHANNGDLLLAAAIAGNGIARLPSFMVVAELESGRLISILDEFPVQDGAIHAVYPQGRHLPQRVRVFTDFLAARFGPEPYWDRALPPA